jgi:hypothetical protein
LQNLFVAVLLSAGKECFWYNQPSAKQQFSLPTEVSVSDDGATEKYWHVSSRWKQHVAIDDFLSYLLVVSDKALTNVVQEMQESHRLSFLPTLIHSISAEHPHLLDGFHISAKNRYDFIRIVKRKLRKIFAVGVIS